MSHGFGMFSRSRAELIVHAPELTRSFMVEAARFDVPPELGALIFGPPLFYSDLWVLRRLV